MVRLTIYNRWDEPIDSMFQWDLNREIHIAGIDVSEEFTYEIHFSNRRMSKALVLTPDMAENGQFIVDVPSEMLEVPETINVYVYAENATTGEQFTITDKRIAVIPRQKPIDYSSAPTDGLISVATGLKVVGDKLYLQKDGETIGEGVTIDTTRAIPTLYGVLELDSNNSDFVSSGVYSMSSQSDLQSAKTWIEDNAPENLDCSVTINNWGGYVMSCSFGDAIYVVPSEDSHNITVSSAYASTGTAGADEYANYFQVHCTQNHIIFVAGNYSGNSFTPTMYAIVGMNYGDNGENRRMTGIVTYKSDNTTSWSITVTDGADSYEMIHLKTFHTTGNAYDEDSPVTILYNCPSCGDVPSVMEDIFVTPNSQYVEDATDEIDIVNLGTTRYLAIIRTIFIKLN